MHASTHASPPVRLRAARLSLVTQSAVGLSAIGHRRAPRRRRLVLPAGAGNIGSGSPPGRFDSARAARCRGGCVPPRARRAASDDRTRRRPPRTRDRSGLRRLRNGHGRSLRRRLHRPPRASGRARSHRHRSRDPLAITQAERPPAPAVHPQSVARRRRTDRGVRDDRADRIQLRHHARHAADRARSQPRRCTRERLVHHERRSRAPGLVRALQERRRRHRLPRPQRPAGAHAHARPPRLRRPPLRPPRRRRERRRQQPARLGRRQGHPRRNRVSQRPGPTSTPARSAASASPSAAS